MIQFITVYSFLFFCRCFPFLFRHYMFGRVNLVGKNKAVEPKRFDPSRGTRPNNRPAQVYILINHTKWSGNLFFAQCKERKRVKKKLYNKNHYEKRKNGSSVSPHWRNETHPGTICRDSVTVCFRNHWPGMCVCVGACVVFLLISWSSSGPEAGCGWNTSIIHGDPVHGSGQASKDTKIRNPSVRWAVNPSRLLSHWLTKPPVHLPFSSDRATARAEPSNELGPIRCRLTW